MSFVAIWFGVLLFVVACLAASYWATRLIEIVVRTSSRDSAGPTQSTIAPHGPVRPVPGPESRIHLKASRRR